jgi:hypothetical protein
VFVPDSTEFNSLTQSWEARVMPHRVEGESVLSISPKSPSPVVVPPQRSIDVPPASDALALSRLPEGRPSAPRLKVETHVPLDDSAMKANAAGASQEVKPEPQHTARQTPELPKSPTISVEPAEKAAATLPPVVLQPKSSALEKGTSPAELSERRPATHPEHDMVAMLPRTVPDWVMPRESPKLPETPASKPSKPQNESVPASPAEEHAKVNVEELAARIAGVNLTLRTIEAELNEKHDWDADRLDGILNRLDILVLRQRDLALFRDLITPDEQSKAGQIELPRQAISAMAARIADVRTRLRSSETVKADAATEATLKHLDELSDRLVSLVTEK